MEAALSVIVPLYNGEGKISRLVKSLYSQTYKGFEILFINDGSKDGTLDELKELIKGYSRDDINAVIMDKENTGVADTRNLGIKKASGRYIMFADQDDYMTDNYIETYVSAIEIEKAQLVVGGYERIDASGRIRMHIELSDTDWAPYIVTAPWAHIYDKAFLTSNDIHFLTAKTGEDVYFNLLALAKANRAVTIRNTDYKWFYNEQSVSNTRQSIIRRDVDPLYFMEEVYKEIRRSGRGDFLKKDTTEYYFARYICWYMLFSTRGSKRDDIVYMYKRVFEWLDKRFPKYRDNSYITRSKPDVEEKSFSFFVHTFYRLNRMRLLLFGLKIARFL